MALLIESTALIGLERRGRGASAFGSVTREEDLAIAAITASEILVGIYTIDSDGNRESELVRVPLDCTGWALFGCAAPHAYWSPDGDLLAFTAVGAPVDIAQLQGSPISDVFAMRADGSGLTKIEGLPKSVPPGGGSHFAGWVNCAGFLPTAGCQVRLTKVGAQGLNMRRSQA